VEASTHGRQVHADSLDNEVRWPAFTPKAVGVGITAMLSTPLIAAGRVAGALNIYSRTVNRFLTREQKLASTFAAEASTILTDARIASTDQARTDRATAILRSREVIAQAQGVIMDREGSTAQNAYATLRRLSVGQRRQLATVAGEIVASTRRPAQPDSGETGA
jgi:AmiR/NasT family two-component response regulator